MDGNNIKINDIDEDSKLSLDEKVSRCKLATLYRIINYYKWTQTIYNHISLRCSENPEHYYVNTFGLLYEEITASNLLKINLKGDILGENPTPFGFNPAGFTLHSAIHEARKDLNCVIHVHTKDVVAVSAMKCRLLPISQEALIVGDVSYHQYEGILIDNKEKIKIKNNLGVKNKVMILENHGLVACGETVEEAFHLLYHVIIACNTQVQALKSSDPNHLIMLDREKLRTRTEITGREDITKGLHEKVGWKVGELQFEATCRKLDRMNLCTGYPYKKPYNNSS